MNFFQGNFAMAKSGAFRIEEIENMVPWKRQIYMSILVNHIEERNKRMESSMNSAKQGKG